MSTEELLTRWERQLRKGLLHLLVLEVLNKDESYGYKLIASLSKLLDADMAEVAAELTALQTKEQLNIQSLSIANQAPQTILALFR